MLTLAVFLGTVSLMISLASAVPHRSSWTLALLPLKFLGIALAGYLAVVGGLGVVLGLIYHSPWAVATGLGGVILSVAGALRISAPHDQFERTFGIGAPESIPPGARERLLRRRWSWKLPGVPKPRWTRDIAFWTIPGTQRRLLADLWEPPATVERSGRGLVYLHGSAWYLLDKDVLTRRLFHQLAAQGHVIMDVAYRLAPETDVRGMVADAKRAVAWLKQNAAGYGVDPAKLVLMGASAGGHIALLSAYAGDHPQMTPPELAGVDTSVAAVVSFYGVTDMRAYGGHTAARLSNPPHQPPVARRTGELSAFEQALHRILLGRPLQAEQSPPAPFYRQSMQELLGGLPDEVPDAYDLASPIHHVSPHSPPTLLLQGAHDFVVPVGSVRHLREELVAAGVPVVYVEFPWTDHAFDLLYPPLVGPAAQAALYDVERFLWYATT